MHKKTIILSAILFFLVVAGMFTYALLKSKEMKNEEVVEVDEKALNEEYYGGIERVDAVHFFADGVHTLVGEFVLPTPCDLLEHEVIKDSANPDNIEISFSIINNADTCIQAQTIARFMVTAEASEGAVFSATFLGKPIVMNIIEAPEGATPDTYELYVK